MRALKLDLSEEGLPQRKQVKYLLALGLLLLVPIVMPAPVPIVWDKYAYASSALLIVFFIGGTLYCFRRNGGGTGIGFLSRYTAIGWLMQVRLMAFFMLVGALAGFGMMLRIPKDTLEPALFLLVNGAQIVVYWRTGHHLADVQRDRPGRRPGPNLPLHAMATGEAHGADEPPEPGGRA